jgi:hypothetical protein
MRARLRRPRVEEGFVQDHGWGYAGGFVRAAEGVAGCGEKSEEDHPRMKATNTRIWMGSHSFIRGEYSWMVRLLKMAADAGSPAAARELGRVLTRLMAGDARVDLSALPREWRGV